MNASAGGAGALHATVNESDVTSEKKSCVIGRNPEIEWQQWYYEMVAPVIKDLLSDWHILTGRRKEEYKNEEQWGDRMKFAEEMQQDSRYQANDGNWMKKSEKMVMKYDTILML